MDRRPGISVGLLAPGSSSGVVVKELASESGEPGVVTSGCSSGDAGLASKPLMAAVRIEFRQEQIHAGRRYECRTREIGQRMQ